MGEVGKFIEKPKILLKRKKLDPDLFPLENHSFLDPSYVTGGSRVSSWAGRRGNNEDPGKVKVKAEGVFANNHDQTLEKEETSRETFSMWGVS